MCGIAGFIDLVGRHQASPAILKTMTDTLIHRGPDSEGSYISDSVALGFRRLSIVDPLNGDQPIFNEDRSIVCVCNGEVFNHKELRVNLERRGHKFYTGVDVEVLVHLYEVYGYEMVSHINGQFAFVIYDKRSNIIFMARDQCGICPLFYSIQGDTLLFSSEIKAILAYPGIRKEVDLVGLDQILCFPGLINPRTMFKGISSLGSGQRLVVQHGQVNVTEYWDINYPNKKDYSLINDDDLVEEALFLLKRSVERRIGDEAHVGVLLSGGLDSSLIASITNSLTPDRPIKSYSVRFDDKIMSEEKYQQMLVAELGSDHSELLLTISDIGKNITDVIYHSEAPIKETYNICSFALANLVRSNGTKVVLGGEGADELFAGYPGYRFDTASNSFTDPISLEERRIRNKLWGENTVRYERSYSAFSSSRWALFSEEAKIKLRHENAFSTSPINTKMLQGRHQIDQRAYLDFHLRLSNHLLADHGDRMLMAHSVEGRYPFLDPDIIDFSTRLHPSMKVRDFVEKYVLKRAAKGVIPDSIIAREKFGFYSWSTPSLLLRNLEWVNEWLSPERIRQQGIFSIEAVERLRQSYKRPGYLLDPRTDDDFLLIVLTYTCFHDLFGLESL